MKKLHLDTRSISAIGVFAAACLVVIMRLVVALRLLGAGTNAFYRDFYAISVSVVAFIIPTVVCCLSGAKSEGVSPLKFFKLGSSKIVLVAVLGFSVCQFAFNFLFEVVWSNVCTLVGYRDFSAPAQIPSGAGEIIVAVLTAAVLPAVGEEGVARGLTGKALNGTSKRTQILVSALIFALLHQSFPDLAPTFVGGLWLTWIYLASGSILAPVIVHFVNNLGAVLCTSFGWTNALHALIATPLGAGVSIALGFVLISAMVGILRLLERRAPVTPALSESCAQNSVLTKYLLIATVVLGTLGTAISLVTGVLV